MKLTFGENIAKCGERYGNVNQVMGKSRWQQFLVILLSFGCKSVALTLESHREMQVGFCLWLFQITGRSNSSKFSDDRY